MPTALITGVSGQDGSHMADLLLEKGYKVYGMIRLTSSHDHNNPCRNFENIRHLEGNSNFIPLPGDVLDAKSLEKVIRESKPDEVYHLAAQSHVGLSFTLPDLTTMTNAGGTGNILQAVTVHAPDAKIYIAGTSEMFGNTKEPQDENTPFSPVSPYGCAKLMACKMGRGYKADGKYVVCGILFNHEGERRGKSFVTRKITRGLAAVVYGEKECLELGNLDARRDWGYSPEYVEAMWRMMQQDKPKDYVIATGETHSIREFVERTAETMNMRIKWEGKELNEIGLANGKPIIQLSPKYFRKNEIHILCGNSTKAQQELGWKPKVRFEQLVEIMAKHDLELLSQQEY